MQIKECLQKVVAIIQNCHATTVRRCWHTCRRARADAGRTCKLLRGMNQCVMYLKGRGKRRQNAAIVSTVGKTKNLQKVQVLGQASQNRKCTRSFMAVKIKLTINNDSCVSVCAHRCVCVCVYCFSSFGFACLD